MQISPKQIIIKMEVAKDGTMATIDKAKALS